MGDMDEDEFDIFGIDSITDIGNGEPLFANFAFEDWALLSLRFELHLLVHAFSRDCSDPERPGFPPEHLPFYYTKYYKKGLSPKNYGVESVEDVLAMVKDAVILYSKVLESQITDDLESNDVFVKLTEESRRNRQRRIDAGDQSAVLKFIKDPNMQQMHQQQQFQQHQQQQQQQQQQVPAGKAVPRPPGLQGSGAGGPVLVAQRPNMGKGAQSKGKDGQHNQKGEWFQPRRVYGIRSPSA